MTEIHLVAQEPVLQECEVGRRPYIERFAPEAATRHQVCLQTAAQSDNSENMNRLHRSSRTETGEYRQRMMADTQAAWTEKPGHLHPSVTVLATENQEESGHLHCSMNPPPDPDQRKSSLMKRAGA